MDECLELLMRLTPEVITLTEKRYNILRTVRDSQPIGRRMLAEQMELGERVIRREIEFLKTQQLLVADAVGVSLSADCELLMPELQELVHGFKGLAFLETYLREALGLAKVLIVPGDLDRDAANLREIGKTAGRYVSETVKDHWVVAVTGGATMAEVARQTPPVHEKTKILVVPARGGLGEVVEIQSNTIAAGLAARLGGGYRLLYVPDDISEEVWENLLLDHKIQETIALAKNANLLLHGIGVPKVMAARRDLDWQELLKKAVKLPVGEAFGYYFAEDGSVAAATPTSGPRLEDLAHLEFVVAVAGGKSKAKAMLAVLRAGFVKVLITDQGAAESLREMLQKTNG